MEYGFAGFNGQRPDPVSGYYHLGNGYRAYSPVLIRFTCPDSLSPFGAGGINPYAYCAGDPVNRADPSGHFSLGQWVGMAVGLVTGIALSVLTEGAAMPVVLTLMATVAGDAAIGAGSELVTEAIDGQRINWGQVGIAAGAGAATALVGYGVGEALGSVNRRLGSWLQGSSRFLRNIQRGEVGGFGIPLSRVVAQGEHGRAMESVVSAIDVTYLGFSSRTLPDSVIAYNGVPQRPWYLDVLVHSGPDINAGGHIRVPVNDYNLDALQFHQTLEANYQDYDAITSIRVIGCHTGNEVGGAESFAAELSNYSQRRVVGYLGVVDTYTEPRLSAYLDRTAPQQFSMSGYNYVQMNNLLRTRLASFTIQERTIQIRNAIPITYEP